jgi:hypothetical protein
MLTKFKFLILTLLMSASVGFAQTGVGTIKGTVTDKETGEELPFVKVIVFKNGNQKGFATTGLDGKFIVASLSPGEYDVELRFVGYQTKREEGVVVNSDKLTVRNYELGATSEMLTEVEVVFYEVPLIDKDGGASGATVTRDDISKMSARSASEVAKTVGGVYSQEGGGDDVNIRGTRSDATYYFIDGIKVRGSSSLPKSSIQEVAVITGGLPANYGDVTGGIISITTRGPSAKYFGSGELVTSGFYLNGEDPLGYDGRVFGTDKYAYNLAEGMISGPLLLKKDSLGNKTNIPILGFFLSANATDQLDSRPLHNGGAYRLKKEVRDDLLDYENGSGPLRPNSEGTGTYYNTNFLTADDFEQVPYRMNNRGQSYSAAGKIDVNAGPTMNLTFGGSMNYRNNSEYSRNNSLLNFENFGQAIDYDWRVYGKFTQRFNNNVEGSTSKIKSAYYSLMVDYSQSHYKRQDATHEDRLFNYGYVGKFKTFRRASYEASAGGDSLIHNGFEDYLVEFTPSDDNPAFSAITSQYYNIYDGQVEGQYENLNDIRAGGALVNGDPLANVYGLWSNTGTPYSTYRFGQNDQLRITGSGTINLNDHAISLGFEYEQRWDRDFSSNPANQGTTPLSLWTVSRQYLNSHIAQLDVNSVTFNYDGTFPRVTYDRLNASPGAYGGQVENDAQYFFDYSVRKALGEQNGLSGDELDAFIDGTDFINLDELDPNFFNLGMFSPDELLNSGQQYFGWRGYDHTGEKVRGATDINDYFQATDEFGNYIRKVGAYQPIYISGYIMDKFAFDDIIFNVGLRADIYDANQPVLKDPYLVYGAKTAKEVSTIQGNDVTHPDNIGDDFVVYVDDVEQVTTIKGYRDGDVWYDATGLEVDNSSVLEGAEGIAPYLNDPTATSPSPTDFEDYTAQINLMPRIAFSFPISDEASFFAHYDILTKRPTNGNIFDPTDYQYIQTRNIIINNPNLLPEKTIDYEIGFQQVLTKTSSIKISAFYKEQRDQVQLIRINNAYPASYTSYGNRDFGTIKGTTVSYDLRRTGNIRINASYTLQFASGTGSDATSAFSLITAGEPNLRTILPYNFDQRHAFTLVVDYRYGGGKDYKGPKINNFGLFENTGLNIQANMGSGTPYSRQQTITAASLINPQTSGLEGTLNGSRLNWTYRVDAQLDRNWQVSFGEDEDGKKKKVAFLNTYIRVNNIFNIVNVLGVYRATGNPSDDGFLLSSQGQNVINSQLDPDSYVDYYSLRTNNPFNLGVPRTIRLGVKFDF